MKQVGTSNFSPESLLDIKDLNKPLFEVLYTSTKKVKIFRFSRNQNVLMK